VRLRGNPPAWLYVLCWVSCWARCLSRLPWLEQIDRPYRGETTATRSSVRYTAPPPAGCASRPRLAWWWCSQTRSLMWSRTCRQRAARTAAAPDRPRAR
jgi:hypothetical protein